MSRLFGLLCEEPVKLSCTILSNPQTGISSAQGAPDNSPKADGWGIGFYRNRSSFLFKKASRVSGEQKMTNISEVVSSRIFVSHLRYATVGDRKEANTHPFRWGSWLFAHFGTINQFRRFRSRILRRLPPAYKKQIRGNTDSEHCFFLYLSQMRGGGSIKKGQIPLCSAVEGLKKFSSLIEEFRKEAEVHEIPVLNFLISNGTYLIATRLRAPLYYYYHGDGMLNETKYISPATGIQYELLQYDPAMKIVVVSSEKLTTSSVWQEIPEKHILTINAALETKITPWFQDA